MHVSRLKKVLFNLEVQWIKIFVLMIKQTWTCRNEQVKDESSVVLWIDVVGVYDVKGQIGLLLIVNF